MYKNSSEQNLSDDVTQSYVIKTCVRKMNIGLIWVKAAEFDSDDNALFDEVTCVSNFVIQEKVEK